MFIVITFVILLVMLFILDKIENWIIQTHGWDAAGKFNRTILYGSLITVFVLISLMLYTVYTS
jgi:hypothetical protein